MTTEGEINSKQNRPQSVVASSPEEVDTNQERYDCFVAGPGSGADKMIALNVFSPRQTIAKTLALSEVITRTEGVAGSIVQCGVYYGNVLMTYANLAVNHEPYNYNCRIFGFDTFAGNVGHNPEKDGADVARQNGYYNAHGAYESVQKAIEFFDRDRPIGHLPKVTLIKGDITEKAEPFLEEHDNLCIRILHTSMVLYEPTMHALRTFAPRVAQGGMIIVQGRFSRNGGAPQALVDYMKEKRQPWKLQNFAMYSNLHYVQVENNNLSFVDDKPAVEQEKKLTDRQENSDSGEVRC